MASDAPASDDSAAGAGKEPWEHGYQVISKQDGNGVDFPQKEDQVTVHYVGRFRESGDVFDSSYLRQRPLKFQVGTEPPNVIQGWDQGIRELSLGQKATLQVRSDFAYKESGYRNVIPPNADLEFDIELLAINDKKAPSHPAMHQAQVSEEQAAAIADSFLDGVEVYSGPAPSKKKGAAKGKSKQKKKGKRK